MNIQAPGRVSDLSAVELEQWSTTLSTEFRAQVEFTRTTIPTPAQSRAWFFDPVSGSLSNTVTKDIKWTAFPKRFPGEYRQVDGDRSLHEEYCEWEVARADGKVVRVTFTTETQDYYDFLWQTSRDKLLALYRHHVSPDVKLSDLGGDGGYNPTNKWNWPVQRRGALMHMAQTNNTLSAAVNLSAVASWPIVDDAGADVVSEQALIGCLKFGEAGRHSDPHIGAQINELVRAGAEVSFSDPIGLYIDSMDLSEFETPDGTSAMRLVRRTRGEDGFAMRLVFEAPSDSAFVLGDVRIAGDPILWGGQIAEKLRIRVRGAARQVMPRAPELDCRTKAVRGSAPTELLTAELARPRMPTSSRMLRIDSILAPE